MSNIYKQTYDFEDTTLVYDAQKSTLLCISKYNKKNLWIKSIGKGYIVTSITYGGNNYFITTESTEFSGEFIAVDENNGATKWYIPGKSYINIYFQKFLYVIFVDNSISHFLLKVSPKDGSKQWVYRVHIDLVEYKFTNNFLELNYPNNYTEKIDINTGTISVI